MMPKIGTAGLTDANKALTTDASSNPQWSTSASTSEFGDVKYGFQAADHIGWVLLNGRAKSALTFTQHTKATALVFGTNLLDAREKYLSYSPSNGNGAIFGSNTTTIVVNNLPTNSFGGTTNTYYGNSAGSNVANGQYGLMKRSNTKSANTLGAGADATQGEPDGLTPPIDHNHSFSLQLNTSGSQTAMDKRQSSLGVNAFIYLGE